jgi:hypothetical protein
MLSKEAMAQLRMELRGVESLDFSDNELITYINRGCFVVNTQLINQSHPSTIKEVTVRDGDDYLVAMPRFVNFAGKYPIVFSNGKVVVDDPSKTCVVRYYANVEKLKPSENKELPIPEDFQDIAIQYARSFSLNRQDMDVTQDAAITNGIVTGVANTGARAGDIITRK